jgi:cell wall-associated NlpC family hydrolase
MIVTCVIIAVDPIEEVSNDLGETVVIAARGAVGRPYRFTGSGPSDFDCSGLVQYCYHAGGLDLPHGTGELMRMARVVRDHDFRKGDLLFFQENGRDYSHVGIYAGGNEFIHAASTSGAVRIDSLLDPYWKERFLDARRF